MDFNSVLSMLKKFQPDINEIADKHWESRYVSVSHQSNDVPPNLKNVKLMTILSLYEQKAKNIYIEMVEQIQKAFTPDEIMTMWENMSEATREELLDSYNNSH